MKKLMQLARRLLDEEIKTFNNTHKLITTNKLINKDKIIDANDKAILINFISNQKKKLLVRFAEKITDKKLANIDFTENNIDQLKIRIFLGKYLGKLVYKIGFAKFLIELSNSFDNIN